MRLAEVIVNRPAKQLNKPFTYEVPDALGVVPVGTRVAIPLGRGKEEGIIVGYAPETVVLNFTVKPILSVLDKTPWFTPEMLATAKRLSHYYLCSYPDALRLFTIDKKELKSYERPKVAWLYPESFLTVESIPARKKRQREAVAYLLSVGGASYDMLKEQGFSLPIIKQVSELSGVRREEKYRHTYTNYDAREIPDIPLTNAQEKVYAPVHDAIIHRRFSPFLLHGVTGSGKTQVYIKAAAACIAENRIAVILVPEIMLTDQIVTRFVEAFGDEVVVFHSKLTISERYNNWERLRRKDSHIIIGARSAVFAPTDDIGLIVVDEEHDGSYKQEDMVRYHARQVALWRAESNSCPVILGSATPSVDSYYKAKKGIYTLLELPERIHHQPLPTVLLVDMKEELLHGNYSVFSDAMTDLIQRTLEKKEQMIMLLNRRGYSTFVMCRECGEPVNCPHCDVSLVYHRANEALRCHYCEYHEPVPEVCPKCGSRKIKFFGSGTQRVEEELAKRFPQARIARLDQDVAAKKGRGEDVLHGFAAGEYDMLLGTQMVAKGHDFEGVTAVGILTADSVLNIPLYTAAERTFDLLTQAAGRAGRGKSEGHVVIQTYNPLHYAIIKSKTHDYKGFYKEEIEARKALGYPPCGEMIHFRMQHEKKDKAMQIATAIVEELSKAFDDDVEVLGPYEEGVNRVRNLYRISVMIRGDTLSDVKKYIYHSWIFTQDGLAIDVDPM